MLDLIKKFEKGTTVYFECLYRGIDGSACDPADSRWEIKDFQGNIISSGTPSKRKEGVWYFFWIATATGSYLLIFSGKIQGDLVIIRKKFKVLETILK